MKKLILGIFTITLFTSSSPSNYETFSKNSRENDKEWESLFDGKSSRLYEAKWSSTLSKLSHTKDDIEFLLLKIE